MQALIYSLVFHLMLFGTFRIRLSDFQEYTPQMHPLDVAIDSEKTEVDNTNTSQHVDKSALFLANLDADEHTQINLALLQDDSDFDDEALKELVPKLEWSPKMYPLKLKLSNSFKDLILVDDASSLFRNKKPQETLARFVLAPHHFTIEYKVSVDGSSGHIINRVRKEELLDKRLQTVADRIIGTIKFLPFNEKERSGSITITFCCTGDEITKYMHSGFLQ